MPGFRDLSNNGRGVFVEPHMAPIDLSVTDAIIPGKMRRLRVTGAGNVIMRPAGSDADMTIAANAGELLTITPGTIIRKTGTTATGLSVQSV